MHMLRQKVKKNKHNINVVVSLTAAFFAIIVKNMVTIPHLMWFIFFNV